MHLVILIANTSMPFSMDYNFELRSPVFLQILLEAFFFSAPVDKQRAYCFSVTPNVNISIDFLFSN